jgi:hypothetical protein
LREDHVLQALTCLGCFPSNSHRIVILPAPACRGSGCDFKTNLSSRLSQRAVEPKRSEVERLFLFCPSDLTTPNKSHYSPLCHPERTRISYFTALPAARYADLRKESRMTSTEATVFDRKPGGGEGSAVRPGSRTKVSVPLVLPQNRRPDSEAGTCFQGTKCPSRYVRRRAQLGSTISSIDPIKSANPRLPNGCRELRSVRLRPLLFASEQPSASLPIAIRNISRPFCRISMWQARCTRE